MLYICDELPRLLEAGRKSAQSIGLLSHPVAVRNGRHDLSQDSRATREPGVASQIQLFLTTDSVILGP